MKKMTPMAACLLAIALTGCGGGGGDSTPATSANGSNGSTAQTNGSGAQTNDSGAPANGGGAQTQFPLRAVQQGDERTYQIVDTFSNSSALTYSRKTVQAIVNADGSGQRQVYDGNNGLIEVETRSYDDNGLLSRHFASTNVTCKYDVKRSSFASPVRVGQTIENRITDTCDNGLSAVVDEKGTIVGAETITVNGTSYSTLKAVVQEDVMVTPPAPQPAYSYSITRTEWIEPTLGLKVKEDTAFPPAAPDDRIYLILRSATLMSYLNK